MEWAVQFTSTICVLLLLCLPGASTEDCGTLSPGVDKLVHGVDATGFDLLPLPERKRPAPFKLPVLSFTCDQSQKFKDRNNKEFDKPDQITSLINGPGKADDIKTTVINNRKSLRVALLNDAYVRDDLKRFAFSGSMSYKLMTNKLRKHRRTLQVSSHYISSSRATIKPSKLSNAAQTYLDELPTTDSEDTMKKYWKFVRKFGTHFMSDATLGGVFRIHTQASEKLAQENTEHILTLIAKDTDSTFLKNYNNYLKPNGNLKYFNRELYDYGNRTIGAHGGNPLLLRSKDTALEWENTVYSNPAIVKCSLRPIYELITDETKRYLMKKAVIELFLRKYLGEARTFLRKDPNKNNYTPDGKKIYEALMSSVNEFKAKKILLKSELEQLVADVDYQIIVPGWFKYTQVCYEYEDIKINGESCWTDNSVSGRKHCARYGENTAWHVDDTGITNAPKDDEKCRLRWTIENTNTHVPSWFAGVKMCFKYRASNAQACEGRSDFCTSLNEHSKNWFYDKSKINSHCSMQWKLDTSGSAPLWLKELKFCLFYHSSSHQSCGQSTVGDDSRMWWYCAPVGQWTNEYLDKTDSVPGGCFLSWGFYPSNFKLTPEKRYTIKYTN